MVVDLQQIRTAMLLLVLLLSNPGVDVFAGEYAYASGSAERGIEAVVDQMVFFVRPIARGRLSDSNRPAARLRITEAGGEVQITFDGRTRITAVDAAPVEIIGLTGKRLAYTLKLVDGALVQTFHGASGGRINTLRVAGDGLVIQVRVYSPRLPADVLYELRYTRVAPTS